MAQFQKREYHPDKTPKHAITQDDISFLKLLQKELNTQPSMGNADPVYWGIMETSEQPTSEDYADATVLVDESGDIVARDLEDAVQYLNDPMNDGLDDEITRCSMQDDGTCVIQYKDSPEERCQCLADIIESLDSSLGDTFGLRLGYLRESHEIRKDALFLTHKDCEDHLKAYGYNYKPDAHAYAMTAVRCPRYETLLRILRETDWDALSGGAQ